jgi:hypothetical protein
MYWQGVTSAGCHVTNYSLPLFWDNCAICLPSFCTSFRMRTDRLRMRHQSSADSPRTVIIFRHFEAVFFYKVRQTRGTVIVLYLCITQLTLQATGYGLDNRGVGFRVPVGSRIFTSPRRPDRLLGPPNLLSNGYRGRAFYPGVKRPGCEADHSPPTSAEVKKMWIYTSTTPYAFMA